MTSPWNVGTFGNGALAWSPDLDWQTEALCKQVGLELFYSDAGETAATAMAKRVCNGDPDKGVEPCPVLRECLSWSLDINDSWAVLGGMSPRQRQRYATEQRRATGGRVRCRVCRRVYEGGPGQLDCSDVCRKVSRKRQDRRRSA